MKIRKNVKGSRRQGNVTRLAEKISPDGVEIQEIMFPSYASISGGASRWGDEILHVEIDDNGVICIHHVKVSSEILLLEAKGLLYIVPPDGQPFFMAENKVFDNEDACSADLKVSYHLFWEAVRVVNLSNEEVIFLG